MDISDFSSGGDIFFYFGIWFANIMWKESFGEFPEVTVMYKLQQTLLLAAQELGVLSFVNLVTLVFVSIFKDVTKRKFSLIKVYLLFELVTFVFLIVTVLLFIFQGKFIALSLHAIYHKIKKQKRSYKSVFFVVELFVLIVFTILFVLFMHWIKNLY